MSGLTEKRFEEHITECLAGSPMYCQREHQDFDIKNMCDRGELLRFMKAQTKAWAKLTKEFGEGALDEVVRVYNSTLDNQGMLHVLKKGIKIKGTEVKFVDAAHKPGVDTTCLMSGRPDGPLVERIKHKYND